MTNGQTAELRERPGSTFKNYSESDPASSLGLKGFKVVSFDKCVLLVEVMALAPLDQFPTVGFD